MELLNKDKHIRTDPIHGITKHDLTIIQTVLNAEMKNQTKPTQIPAFLI